MSKLQVYTNKGMKSGEMEFPKELVAKENVNLMTQALHVFEDRSHKGTSKVKTRAEVSLSTRKIYRQKGTGGARHGDKKAPIFVGGGVAHGPKGIKRELRLSKNLNRLALKMFLAQKVSVNSLCIVTSLDNISKTKEAASLLVKIGKDMNKDLTRNVLVVLGDTKKGTSKYFRNIEGVRKVTYWKDLNLREVHQSSLVVIDRDVLSERQKNTRVKEIKGVVSPKVKNTESKKSVKKELKKPVKREVSKKK